MQQFYRERNQQILDNFEKLAPGKGPKTAWAGSYMQIRTPRAGVHFEWIFRGRRQDKKLNVAVHFETNSRDLNHKLCAALGENKAALEQSLGETLQVNPDWTSEWSSVYMERPCEPWSEDIASWASEKMDKLIQASQPLLEEFYAKT